MKRIWFYVIRELFWPFLFGILLSTFVLIMDAILDVMNLIITKGVPTPVVLEFFGLSLAYMLALSIPMGVLVGAIMGFGRLSADNEMIAFNACGVSLADIMAPGLIMSLVIAAGLTWFNNYILPEANHRARLLMTDITRKKPTWSLEENVFLDYFDNYHILVKKIDHKSSRLSDITIFEHKNPGLPRTITAARGDMKIAGDGSLLILQLYDGQVHEPDPENPYRYRRIDFKKQLLTIEGVSSELERTKSGSRGDREMTLPMMLEENRKSKMKIAESKARIDQLVKGDLNRLLGTPPPVENRPGRESPRPQRSQRIDDLASRIEYETGTINTYKKQINSMNVEIHKKFSIPVACIVFVLLGAPLGVMTRKGGMAASLGLSLFFFILYWAFLIGGEELADRMYLSGAIAMWLPNLIIGAAGLILTSRVNRRATAGGLGLLGKLLPGTRK